MYPSKNIIWLASYPKSGNTWFRSFLYSLTQKGKSVNINQLPANNYGSRGWFEQVVGITSSHLTRKELSKLRPQSITWLAQQHTKEVYIKTHEAYTIDNGFPLMPTQPSRVAIYLVRNPLDVAVSYTHHIGAKKTKRASMLICSETHSFCNEDNRITPQFPQMMSSWSSHIKSWRLQKNIPVTLIRYEDMLLDSFNTFKKAVMAMQLDYTDKEIINAIQQAQFDKLQAYEKQNGFEGKHVLTKPFFRKGRIGAWREELPTQEVEKIIEKHYDMMKELQYLDDQDQIIF